MLIIKPYGRTVVQPDANERRISLRKALSQTDTPININTFAREHPDLVIAQWVSIIDKIAKKPKHGKKATQTQQMLRHKIGAACWSLIIEKELIAGDSEEDFTALAKKWERKIHPYKVDQTKKGYAKGRSYDRIASEVEPEDIDGNVIAAKIYDKLYGTDAYKGLIHKRANSIAKNTLKANPCAKPAFDQALWETYNKHDIAKQIHDLAKAKTKEKNKSFFFNDAAEALYAHWGIVFQRPNGSIMTAKEAAVEAENLLELHRSVKDVYARILRRKNLKAEHALEKLPKSAQELKKLIEQKAENSEINALIRLGKIIHYEASGNGDDHVCTILNNWPENISESPYLTSEGQAQIKRNEAFVRVWRQALTSAANTLKGWADPKNNYTDVFLKIGAIEQNNSHTPQPQKLTLLFGKYAASIKDEKEVLIFALKVTAALRHNSFHFKGMRAFVDSLNSPLDKSMSCGLSIANELYKHDQNMFQASLLETLEATHCNYFFTLKQCQKILTDISSKNGTLPLPRFNRVLLRIENTKGHGLKLPPPATARDLESASRLCQYTTLKSLYEKPFRHWVEGLDQSVLKNFMREAVELSTSQAKSMNGDDAIARAAAFSLEKEDEGIDLRNLFFTLSAETASEMRVQKHYQSDAEQAQKQAAYIENFKCDVIGRAFDQFIRSEGYEFVTQLNSTLEKPEKARFSIKDLRLPQGTVSTIEPWQAKLYFMLHLVPVDDANALMHQLRKWQILTEKAANRREMESLEHIQAVLQLYLDMHDVKFTGESWLLPAESFAGFYEEQSDFSRMLPQAPNAEAIEEHNHLPLRGLREILRFGHLEPLNPIYEENKVSHFDVLRLQELENQIKEAHEKRAELHDKWAKSKNGFNVADYQNYIDNLKIVIEHRQLSAHATLRNHVRLHKLLMKVLGRMVDYAGMWERDLYFVTLAHIYQSDLAIDDVFENAGRVLIKQGQFTDAVAQTMNMTQQGQTAIRSKIESLFLNNKKIRNDFAHFNMLHANQPSLKGSLTKAVNDGRKLMAYDRKLKNAVSKSIMELAAREGITIKWISNHSHELELCSISTRQALHLENKARNNHTRNSHNSISENLHGDSYMRMATALFSDMLAEQKPVKDVLQCDSAKLAAAKKPAFKNKSYGKNNKKRFQESQRKYTK